MRFAAILLAVFLAACSAAQAVGPNTVYVPVVAQNSGFAGANAPTVTPTPPPSLAGTVVNTTGNGGQPFRVVVTGSELRTSMPGANSGYEYIPTPTPVTTNERFLVILADVTNQGSISDYLGTYRSELAIIDSAGRRFEFTTTSAQSAAEGYYDRKGPYDRVPAGFTYQMVFVFDVLASSTGFAFVGLPTATPTRTPTPSYTPTPTYTVTPTRTPDLPATATWCAIVCTRTPTPSPTRTP